MASSVVSYFQVKDYCIDLLNDSNVGVTSILKRGNSLSVWLAGCVAVIHA